MTKSEKTLLMNNTNIELIHRIAIKPDSISL